MAKIIIPFPIFICFANFRIIILILTVKRCKNIEIMDYKTCHSVNVDRILMLDLILECWKKKEARIQVFMNGLSVGGLSLGLESFGKPRD